MYAQRTQPTIAGLQQHLGYTFRNPALLQQACTHSEDRSRPSYKELGFVGDAVLWAVYAEHAFRCSPDTPRSGKWGTHMGKLLSRSSLAATAKAWGLQQYLQLAMPCEQPPAAASALSGTTSTSRSSSSVDISSPRRQVTSLRPSAATPEAEGSLEQALRRRAGRTAFWSSDELGEMLEGVVGALLLDSSYAAVGQLLRPWVASSYAAEVAEHQANGTAGGDPMQPSGDIQQQQQQQEGAGRPSEPSSAGESSGAAHTQPDTALLLLLERIRAERRYWYEALRAALQRHQQQYRATQEGTRLAAQIAAQVATGLHQHCGGCSLSPGQLQQAGWLLLEQLELRPSEEGQRLQYLGHALLRLCVAVHVFEEGQAAADAAPAAAAILADVSGLQSSLEGGAGSGCGSAWRTMHAMAAAAGDDEDYQHDKEQQQERLAHADHLYYSICPLESTTTNSGSNSTNSRQHSSSSSRSGSGASPPHVPTDAVSSDDDSCSTGSSSGSAVSLVQQLNKRFMCLHSMRYRFRMALQLGLDPALWLTPGSPFMAAPRKQQRAALGHCLEVLAALLYLEQGMPALQAAAGQLLDATPAIQLHKDWMPLWLNKN